MKFSRGADKWPLQRGLQTDALKHPVLLFKLPTAAGKEAALQTVTIFAYMAWPMLQLPCSNYPTFVKKPCKVELCMKHKFCPRSKASCFVPALSCKQESPQTQQCVQWHLLPPLTVPFLLLQFIRELPLMFLQFSVGIVLQQANLLKGKDSFFSWNMDITSHSLP